MKSSHSEIIKEYSPIMLQQDETQRGFTDGTGWNERRWGDMTYSQTRPEDTQWDRKGIRWGEIDRAGIEGDMAGWRDGAGIQGDGRDMGQKWMRWKRTWCYGGGAGRYDQAVDAMRLMTDGAWRKEEEWWIMGWYRRHFLIVVRLFQLQNFIVPII